MSKPKKKGAKYQCLREIILDFAVEIGHEAGKEDFNRAWRRLLRDIDKLGLFAKD